MPTREHTPRQSPPHPSPDCAPTAQHTDVQHLRLGTPKSGRRFPTSPTPTPLAHTEE